MLGTSLILAIEWLLIESCLHNIINSIIGLNHVYAQYNYCHGFQALES